jgi:hypothetical protein
VARPDKEPPTQVGSEPTAQTEVDPVKSETVKAETTKPVDVKSENVKPPITKPRTKAAIPNVQSQTVLKSAEVPPSYQEDSGGLSQKDIPALLRMAQADAGAGSYDKARTEFQKILRLQPNNQDAKEGLRKLGLAEGQR